MKLTIDKLHRRYGRVSFYAHGIFRDVLPYSLFKHRLKAAFDRLAAGARDNEDLFARARYYNRMRTGAELADAGRIDRLKLTQSYYYYDLRVCSRKRISGEPSCHELDHCGLDEGEACR